MALWQDVRFALRLLTKHRWCTMTAVLPLAVGITATSTVFRVDPATTLREG